MARIRAARFAPVVASKSASINLLPVIARYARQRADHLGLNPALFFRILLQGYLHGPPLALPPLLGKRGKLKRQPVQCSLPVKLRRAGQQRARRWHMSFSELMESLVIADAEDESPTLTVYPPNERDKPELDLP